MALLHRESRSSRADCSTRAASWKEPTRVNAQPRVMRVLSNSSVLPTRAATSTASDAMPSLALLTDASQKSGQQFERSAVPVAPASRPHRTRSAAGTVAGRSAAAARAQVAFPTSDLANRFGDREERQAVRAELDIGRPHSETAVVLDAQGDLLHQVTLAGAGFTGDENCLRISCLDQRQSLVDQCHLVGPAHDDGRGFRPTPRVNAVISCSRAAPAALTAGG